MKIKHLNKVIIYIFLIILVSLAVGIEVFNKYRPIVIGFSAQLTGKQSELGIQERNGVQLAVENINSSGGINGREVKLIIKDDFGQTKKAGEVDEELIKAGAVAIVGHATSSQTLEALKVTNPNNVIMIGPTISTPKLSGIDDYFFRVTPSFEESCKAFSKYIFENKEVHRLAIIYDSNNEAYSKTYSLIFSSEFKSFGGDITDQEKFASACNQDFTDIISKINDSKPDGLLIIASDTDTAIIAQRVRLMGQNTPLFTTDWSQTQTLITNGGKAVEGMILPQTYILNSDLPCFTEFKSSYEKRFGNTPSFGAAFGYEAVSILSEALKKTDGNTKGLKEALLGIKNFHGVINNFSFDKYGDVHRPTYLSTIKDGKFVVIDQINEK